MSKLALTIGTETGCVLRIPASDRPRDVVIRVVRPRTVRLVVHADREVVIERCDIDSRNPERTVTT